MTSSLPAVSPVSLSLGSSIQFLSSKKPNISKVNLTSGSVWNPSEDDVASPNLIHVLFSISTELLFLSWNHFLANFECYHLQWYPLTQSWTICTKQYSHTCHKETALGQHTFLCAVVPKYAPIPLALTTEGEDLPSTVRAWIPFHIDLCLKNKQNWP